jgi:hypothetical protein
MGATHNRRLKLIEFSIDSVQYECQVKSWKLDPGIEDGDRMYAFCPDGQFVEETDPDPTLDLVFFADWRSAGISRYLTDNSGSEADFVLDHHPDIPAEHVTWTGVLMIKAPPVGGEARETELTEITLQVVGTPVFTKEVP